MKAFATLIMGMLLVAAVAGTVSGAEEEDTCAVLFDFGNGQVMWADVPVAEGMNAFNVTVEAADALGLDFHYQDFGWGIQIGPIEGLDYSAVTNQWWGVATWNSTTSSWDFSSVGVSDIPADSVDAIAISYAPDGMPTVPATPEHRYPWTSFRHDSMNSGMQELGNIEFHALNWSKDLGNGYIDSSVIGAKGLVYVISDGVLNEDWSYVTNSTLFCMDMTGKNVWNADIGTGIQLATPLLYMDMVIVSSSDGYVYAFDATDGTKKWTFDTGSRTIGWTIGMTSSPVAYIDHILVAAGNGKLYSIYASNGTEDWNVTVSANIYSSSPAVHNGVVYIGDDSGNVSAYAADGSGKIWSTSVGAKEVRASPLLDTTRNMVIVTSKSGNGNITALNMTTGAIIWQTDLGGSSASVAMTSTGYVAVTTTSLVMVDFDGKRLWNYALGIGGGAPTVVGDTIFAVTNEASSRLIAVDLTGKLVKEFVLDPANYAVCSPTFIDGSLFVTSNNGYVYAFSTGSAPIPPADPEAFPWMLVGGLAAVIVIAAVGLVYWRGKKA